MPSTTTPETLDAPAADRRTPTRIRHALRFRRLEVRKVERVTPHLIRVTLGGSELEGFISLGFDDHAKLFFPDPVTGELVVPTVGPDGPSWPEGRKPTMRDYTPRRYNPATTTLEIDFALHQAGPATAWAERVKPGDALGVGGPRGSMLIPTTFDGYLLVGDDTALPAIARRLTELPAGAPAVLLLEVDSEADRITFDTRAAPEVHWVYRRGAEPGTGTALLDALRATTLPAGDFHAWVACESNVAKSLRAHLVGERGANPKWTKAAGYWRRGAVATHDTHED